MRPDIFYFNSARNTQGVLKVVYSALRWMLLSPIGNLNHPVIDGGGVFVIYLVPIPRSRAQRGGHYAILAYVLCEWRQNQNKWLDKCVEINYLLDENVKMHTILIFVDGDRSVLDLSLKIQNI